MDIKNAANELKKVSLSMFRKNFLGVFHGSISARIEQNQFLINKQNAIFDDLKDDDLTLLYSKKDYRWNDASMDADIHLNIYKNINEAKFVCYAMPHYVTAYALKHAVIAPKDYFGMVQRAAQGVLCRVFTLPFCRVFMADFASTGDGGAFHRRGTGRCGSCRDAARQSLDDRYGRYARRRL